METVNILVASSYHDIGEAISEDINDSSININISVVYNIDDLIKELRKDTHDFLIVEYTLGEYTVEKVSSLIYSEPLRQHAIPIYLIKETVHFECASLILKEQRINLVSHDDLLSTLKKDKNYRDSNKIYRGSIELFKPNLLIIEDDEMAASLLSLILKNTFFNIDIAYLGNEGFAKWIEKKHDLILLDLMLPDTNGEEILNRIMAIDKCQPVIIMTAFNEEHLCEQIILNGASEFIAKPIDKAKLIDRVNYVLDLSKLIKQRRATVEKEDIIKKYIIKAYDAITDNKINEAISSLNKIKEIYPINIE